MLCVSFMIEEKNSERGREGRRLIRCFKRGCRNSADTNASAHTPKAGAGQSSIGSISQQVRIVKIRNKRLNTPQTLHAVVSGNKTPANVQPSDMGSTIPSERYAPLSYDYRKDASDMHYIIHVAICQ